MIDIFSYNGKNKEEAKKLVLSLSDEGQQFTESIAKYVSIVAKALSIKPNEVTTALKIITLVNEDVETEIKKRKG